MPKKYIISVDQSTTATKLLLLDEQLKEIKKIKKGFDHFYPGPCFAEYNADQIIEGVFDGINELLDCVLDGQVEAISLSVQTGSFAFWDKDTGKLLYNMIGWQDARGKDIMDSLSEKSVRKMKDSGYTPALDTIPIKILWLLNQVPGLKERVNNGQALFGTVESWLVYNLDHRHSHITNRCNAGITHLYDIYGDKWNKCLLDEIDLSQRCLPRIINDDEVCGHFIDKNNNSIPIVGVMGDSAAAMFGRGCHDVGDAKVTYGTGASFLINIGEKEEIDSEMFSVTVGWHTERGKSFVLEGTVFYAGVIMEWLKNKLRLPITFDGTDTDVSKLAKSLEDNGGVYFVPFDTKNFSPRGNGDSTAGFIGLTQNCEIGHVVRAAIESTAYQVRYLMDDVSNHSNLPRIRSIKADGGGSRNQFQMQLQSDLLNVPIVCNQVDESSAVGAALMAGLAIGLWGDSEEIISYIEKDSVEYFPNKSRDSADKCYQEWKKAMMFMKS